MTLHLLFDKHPVSSDGLHGLGARFLLMSPRQERRRTLCLSETRGEQDGLERKEGEKKRSKTDKEKEVDVGGRQGKPCQLYLLADLCSAITLPCSRDLFIPIPPHWSGSLSSYIPYMLACLLATLAWWHDWPPKFNSISIFPYLTWIHGQNAREIGKQRVGGI